jgi:hypothetical protein
MVNKLMILFGIVLILSAIFGYRAAMDKTKYGISLEITVKDDVVTNVIMEQVKLPFFYKQTSGTVNFPDISVNAKPDMLEAKPVTYWASSPYTGDGIYTMTLTFEGSPPKSDDFLILPIRITDERGHIIYKQTGFYTWK